MRNWLLMMLLRVREQAYVSLQACNSHIQRKILKNEDNME